MATHASDRAAPMSAADVPAGAAESVPAARTRAASTQWISWVALAMMTTSSVASLRAAPTMAVYGLACVFLYLLPAVVFLLPTSLVSAELASGWEGGIYKWVSEGISKPMGFLAVWCQFAMTIFYYPSLLGFVASTLAYVFNPELASSGVWTACGDHRRLLVRCLGLLARHQGRGGPRQRRPDHRHPDPGRGPGPARRGVPRPGQRVRGADDRRQPPPGLGRALQPGADRQQLPLLLRHGDERGARVLAEEPGQGVPEVDVPGHGPGPRDLHPAGAGDQLDRARPRSSPSPPA